MGGFVLDMPGMVLYRPAGRDSTDGCGDQERRWGMRRWMRVCGLVVAVFLVGAMLLSAAGADTIYGTKWKYSAKPEKATGLHKEKAVDLNVCTFRDNGTFQCGPIQNGTWWTDPKGKFQANISMGDMQRILNALYGPGAPTITSVRQTRYKLKEKEGKPGKKKGKLKFQLKARVHVSGDLHVDIKVKFSGIEL
jgi:hypothetical protein